MKMNTALQEPPSCLLSTDKRVTLRLTLEPGDVLAVREAIVTACGESEILRIQPVPRSTQVQVWLVLAESTAPNAMSATLKTVPYGEIGPVIQQHQNLERRRQYA
jgi:hypothetical protein